MKRAKPIVVAAFIIVLIIVGVVAFRFGAKKDDATTTGQTANTSQASDRPVSTSTKTSYVAINQGLTSLPSGALSGSLITLDVSHNQISSLPSQIGQLTRLESLNVSYNKLSGALPGEIRKMSLKSLDASYNSLTGVPAEIGQLSNLKTINLSYNQLTGLPNELANIPVVDVLDLSYNQISSITDLSKYKNVKVLKLTGNKLTASQISQLQSALSSTQIIAN